MMGGVGGKSNADPGTGSYCNSLLCSLQLVVSAHWIISGGDYILYCMFLDCCVSAGNERSLDVTDWAGLLHLLFQNKMPVKYRFLV